ISGLKFNDINGNGVRDAGEPGLPGWTIQATNLSTGAVSTAVSDATGSYSFPALPGGAYRVREVVQPGWVQTSPNPPDVLVTLGSSAQANFGNFRFASISGHKFRDQNRNGVEDPGEPGIPNVG